MINRKLRLVANISGFDTLIAEVKIQNFADEIEVKKWTDLVCPICGEKTEYHGGYVCQKDKAQFNHWSKLKRVIKGTAKELLSPRLLPEKETATAKLSYLTAEEFAKTYVDATRKEGGEKGVLLTEDASAKNLFKLLVAVEQLHYVIVCKWNDTTEEIVGLLTVSASGRILIKEIIPSNLAIVKETLFLRRDAITPQEVDEAKAFVSHFIPKATPETFQVHDYRVQWKDGVRVEAPEAPVQKVVDIKEILEKALVVPQAKPKKQRKV